MESGLLAELNWHRQVLRWKVERIKEDVTMWFAWRLPKYLVYWAAIRLIAHATTGKYSDQEVPALAAMDALKRWEKP